jgi:hypothetical protein
MIDVTPTPICVPSLNTNFVIKPQRIEAADGTAHAEDDKQL